MSEITGSYSGADERSRNAQVLKSSIELARSGAELRTSYDANVPDRSFDESSKEAILDLTEAATAKLWQLGLDLTDTNDERIFNYRTALQAIYDSDKFGTGRWHPTDRVETPWFSSYHRILSGLNPNTNERLQLLPQVDLVQKSLLGAIALSSLAFTAGDQYTRPNYGFPRKAGRTVTDPNSPFWGYSIATDDCPGKQFGLADGFGPDVAVRMPTGLISNKSVLALKQLYYQYNDTWRNTFGAQYVPGTILAQYVTKGYPERSSDQVDTTSGHVAQFLETARTL